MTHNEALAYGRGLLLEHGLSDWDIRLDRAKIRCGCCWYQEKLITISRYHIDLNTTERVIDTIKHEVAHALTPYHYHDDVWKEACRLLGCVPAMHAEQDVIFPEPDYYAICKHCGVKHTKYRFRKGYAFQCSCQERVPLEERDYLEWSKIIRLKVKQVSDEELHEILNIRGVTFE